MSETLLPARPKIRRREFKALFELFVEQPWLQEPRRKRGLRSLLHGLCQNLDEQTLVCELLHRFKFLDSTNRGKYLKKIAAHIVDDWQLRDTNTQIVATAADYHADSAQAMLQELRPWFVERGWSNVQAISTLGKACHKIADFPNVVLVDEFSGTGNTVRSRVRYLRSQVCDKIKASGRPREFTVRVCLLACMADALQAMRADGLDVFAPLILRKGISQHYNGDDLASARARMQRLESNLSPQIDNEPLPSFGYGGAEALFSTDGNAPNSVFPVFWWPRCSSGESRVTILYREQFYVRQETK